MESLYQHSSVKVATVMLLLVVLNKICIPGDFGMALIISGFEVMALPAFVLFFGTVGRPIFPQLAMYADLIQDYGLRQKDYIWFVAAAIISIGAGFPLLTA